MKKFLIVVGAVVLIVVAIRTAITLFFPGMVNVETKFSVYSDGSQNENEIVLLIRTWAEDNELECWLSSTEQQDTTTCKENKSGSIWLTILPGSAGVTVTLSDMWGSNMYQIQTKGVMLPERFLVFEEGLIELLSSGQSFTAIRNEPGNVNVDIYP